MHCQFWLYVQHRALVEGTDTVSHASVLLAGDI